MIPLGGVHIVLDGWVKTYCPHIVMTVEFRLALGENPLPVGILHQAIQVKLLLGHMAKIMNDCY
jgi:hypothetical protein